MKKILLDTNAYSNYLRGNEAVLDALATAHIVYMSVFVLGELYYGFRGGTRERENRHNLRLFTEKPTVTLVEATAETAEIFGEVKDTLKRQGTPIPINDLWIAAQTIETGSVLVTLDQHFKQVPGLRIWDFDLA